MLGPLRARCGRAAEAWTTCCRSCSWPSWACRLLLYVILDGYDLGIGMLLPLASDAEKDTMIAAIGPFWDANETWLVLGVGVLLIAFPAAHGLVLTSLYIAVTIMLFGLILRGVSFDFRVKAEARQKRLWNRAFAAGSLIAALAQGWMLGSYITGLETRAVNIAFAALIALTLPALYRRARRRLAAR